MIEGGERADVWNEDYLVARKSHACGECGRAIDKGERYTRIGYLQDGSWGTHKLCAHCRVACDWLWFECGGFLCEGVHEDIHEHAEEYRSWPLRKIEFGMRRKWEWHGKRMRVPMMPPFSEERSLKEYRAAVAKRWAKTPAPTGSIGAVASETSA
jgi:hypothetical protein